MFLSRLDLHGFKSFADKTTLAFSAGVTCIVGPNGSGKSNVVDAVRWVIGEQRARVLRSDAMASVLFNGSKSRKPLGLADVRLTVENTRGVLPSAYTEVTVGRRLYRSGESEYLLNGVECRLRDVQDLFLDTGLGAGAYSIIELSMVEDLLSEADEDRRRLFEEAAGVTRYKLRRRQALARLDATRHDLARVRDLDGELDARVASLRRQADRAARHRDLSARLARLDDLLAHAEHARLVADRDAAGARLRGLDTDLASADARLATLDAHAAALALARTSAETARLDARQRLDAHLRRVRDLDAEHRLATERLARARADAARVGAEHDEATRRRAAIAGAAHRLERESADAAPEAAAAAAALQSAQAARDRARQALDAARANVRAAQADEARAATSLQSAERERDRAATRRDLLSADLARLPETDVDAPADDTAARASADAARAGALADADAARQSRDAADALRVRLDADTAALQSERRAADARLATIDAEARVLRRLVEQQTDRAGAVRALAAADGIAHHAGVLVTLADVLRPDGPAAGAALRAVLGPALGDLVAATTAEADALLAHLRASGAGQATVHVLELVGDDGASDEGRPTADDGSGNDQRPTTNDQPLTAHVAAAAPRYERLRDALLGDVWMVTSGDAAAARAAATPGRVFVAPDGTWAAGARRHGGSATPGEAAPSRLDQVARLDALSTDADAARQALAALDARQHAIHAQRAATDAAPHRRALDAAAAALRQSDAAIARLDADARSAARQRAERDARRQSLAAEIDRLDAALPALDAPLDAAAAALQSARAARQSADAALPDAERQSDAAQSAERDAALRDADARRRLDQLARDAARQSATLRDLDRQQTARASDIGRLDAAARAADDALRAARAALDAAAPDRHGLEDAATRADAALLDADAAASDHDALLRDARRAREAALLAVQDTRARHAALAEQLTALLARLADERGDPFDPDALAGDPDLDAFAPDAARAERADVRRRLDGLGAVNALALDEFEAESARLSTIRAQLADLEAAEATLGQTIDELNAEASRRFRETFGQIQASFARLFADLFGEGASAEVRLADPRAPLESAIEITARPAGKRPAAITQLSGGEKTLTAIALLFAIYLVKPSPFCLLDEVDAPLDEANVERFMALLRRFAGETQFLVITHNKRTMELADRLYGVTMQEPGVSTVVSVDFERAAEIVG